MDIKKLYTAEAHEAGSEMQVNDENGNPLDLFISMKGVDSRAYKEASSVLRQQIIAGEKGQHEIRAQAAATVATAWRGFTDGGKKVPFCYESVLNLYLNAPYILEQADRFLAQRGNFTKSKEARSKSSRSGASKSTKSKTARA